MKNPQTQRADCTMSYEGLEHPWILVSFFFFFLISAYFYSNLLFIYLFIYIFYFWLCWVFVSVRGLSPVAASGGHSSSRCAGLFTIAASLVAEHRLQTCRLSSCGSRDSLLHGMWDLPRPGLEPVSPALAGRFSTTAPPGKPEFWLLEGNPWECPRTNPPLILRDNCIQMANKKLTIINH